MSAANSFTADSQSAPADKDMHTLAIELLFLTPPDWSCSEIRKLRPRQQLPTNASAGHIFHKRLHGGANELSKSRYARRIKALSLHAEGFKRKSFSFRKTCRSTKLTSGGFDYSKSFRSGINANVTAAPEKHQHDLQIQAAHFTRRRQDFIRWKQTARDVASAHSHQKT